MALQISTTLRALRDLINPDQPLLRPPAMYLWPQPHLWAQRLHFTLLGAVSPSRSCVGGVSVSSSATDMPLPGHAAPSSGPQPMDPQILLCPDSELRPS